MDSILFSGIVGSTVYESCLPIRERQRRRHQGAAVFAMLVMLLGMIAALVAGIHSTGCASQQEADAAVALATRRIDELKAQEAAAAAKHDAAAVQAARAKRESMEAGVAAVQGAAAAKPTETEQAATTAAGMIPGGIGLGVGAAIGLVGHLMRSRTLGAAVAALQRQLGNAEADRDNVIESIEDARVQHPEFAAAFTKAAPTIRRRQNPSVRARVNRVQQERVGSVDGSTNAASSAPAPSA